MVGKIKASEGTQKKRPKKERQRRLWYLRNLGERGVFSLKAAEWSRKVKSKHRLSDAALTVFADFCESSYRGSSGAKEAVWRDIIERASTGNLERSLAGVLAVQLLSQGLWLSRRFKELSDIFICSLSAWLSGTDFICWQLGTSTAACRPKCWNWGFPGGGGGGMIFWCNHL